MPPLSSPSVSLASFGLLQPEEPDLLSHESLLSPPLFLLSLVVDTVYVDSPAPPTPVFSRGTLYRSIFGGYYHRPFRHRLNPTLPPTPTPFIRRPFTSLFKPKCTLISLYGRLLLDGSRPTNPCPLRPHTNLYSCTSGLSLSNTGPKQQKDLLLFLKTNTLRSVKWFTTVCVRPWSRSVGRTLHTSSGDKVYVFSFESPWLPVRTPVWSSTVPVLGWGSDESRLGSGDGRGVTTTGSLDRGFTLPRVSCPTSTGTTAESSYKMSTVTRVVGTDDRVGNPSVSTKFCTLERGEEPR